MNPCCRRRESDFNIDEIQDKLKIICDLLERIRLLDERDSFSLESARLSYERQCLQEIAFILGIIWGALAELRKEREEKP